MTSWIFKTNTSYQQSKQQGHRGFQHTGVANEYCTSKTQNNQPEVFKRRKLQSNLGQSWREKHHHDGAKQAANRREHQSGAKRDFRLSFERHLVGLVCISCRRRRTRDTQQGTRNITRENRHGRGSDDGSNRWHWRHKKGNWHQQGGGHGGAQSWNSTYKKSEEG